MKLQVLYFDGCPGHGELLPVLGDLARTHGIELDQLRVETIGHAERERFLGSPSVRVDGVDVERGAENRTDFGLKCRLYRDDDGLSRVPPRQWIERALGRAAPS